MAAKTSWAAGDHHWWAVQHTAWVVHPHWAPRDVVVPPISSSRQLWGSPAAWMEVLVAGYLWALAPRFAAEALAAERDSPSSVEAPRQHPQQSLPRALHSSIHAWSAAMYIVSSVLRTSNRETSYHIWSWSSRSCCMQLVFSLPTLVSSPQQQVSHAARFGLCHVRCSVAAVGPFPWVSLAKDMGTQPTTDLLAKDMWHVKHLNGLTLVSECG